MKKSTINFSELFSVIIKQLRTGDYGNASAELNQTLQLMQQELLSCNIVPKDLQKLFFSLQTLYSMQKMEDWVAVADILEYEFTNLWEDLIKNKNFLR